MLVFFLFISISTDLIAREEPMLSGMRSEIIYSYNSLIDGKVTNELLANYKIYRDSPNEYWDFLREVFLDNWNFDATIKALLGKEISNSLPRSELTELSRTLEITLLRYAFEILPFYDNQKLRVIDLKINKQKTFAWLKINMDSPRFPDIHLDVLLKRTDNNHWKGADFRFKGVTYVTLKKNSYRQDFVDLKFRGLLKKLEDKNRVFFENLCKGESNYSDPTKKPCL